MWEIPVYGIIMPIVTIAFSLVSTIRFKKYLFMPITIFVVLNIPTVILPMTYNVGWAALFGWATFYTFISLIISLIVWLIKRSPKPV